MHLSARESVDLLRAARDGGVEASGEVTPHHLCLTDEAVRSLDPNLKMNPPLRTADDRAALNTALVEPGVIDLATLLERMSAGPARIFGLERPRVAVGAPANLVLLSP